MDGYLVVTARPANKYKSKWLKIYVVAEFMRPGGFMNPKKDQKYDYNQSMKKYREVKKYKGKTLIKMWCNPRGGVCETGIMNVRKAIKVVAK